MKISYWSDYNCPYCYIGVTRLNKAIKELNYEDIKMDIHSFELDSNAPKTSQSTTLERFSEKYNMSIENAKKEIEKITKWAVDEGLTMNYETARFTNSRDAHRLTKLAIESNDQKIINKFSNLLFEAYFSKNLELSDKEVLIDVATNAGLEKNKVLEVLDSTKFDDEVELDERVALNSGIQGVPYFIFNNKYAVPGALPVVNLKMFLKKLNLKRILLKNMKPGNVIQDLADLLRKSLFV